MLDKLSILKLRFLSLELMARQEKVRIGPKRKQKRRRKSQRFILIQSNLFNSIRRTSN